MTWCKCLEGIFPSLCDGYVAGRKPILTPLWNCFLDLLFIVFIIIIQNGLPHRILPLCLTATLKCLFQNPVHLWMAGRKKLTHPLPEVCYSRRCFQDSVQFSHSVVSDSATPWTAARQASLSITNSQSLLKLMSIKSVMPSNHLILCCPLLLPPSIFPSIRVFSNESVLHIRWPKYWCFSFNISPCNEHSGLISFRRYWLDLLVVQGTLKSLLQHHSSKASRLMAFLLCFLTSPHLWSIKEPGIQNPIKWWFWGTSLPSSQSAGSLFKVSSCLNTSPIRFTGLWCGSRTSLDWITERM